MMGFLFNVLSIIAALMLLIVLVTVHELGHYSAGRLLRFRIEEFSIGLGPKLFGRERNGIIYSLRALPIGGMCRFYGEDEAPDNGQSMNAQKPWKRFLVILAGPVMNLLVTFLLSAIFLMAYGGLDFNIPTVQSLSQEVPIAAEAGMLPGDILYAIDDVRVEDPAKVVDMIRAANSDMVVTVQRAGKLQDIVLHDVYNEELGYNVIGINVVLDRQRYGFFGAISEAFPFVFSTIRDAFSALGGIFKNGVQQGEVMGIVGTVATISVAVQTNLEIVLYIAILLSISLAIFNLLPIPALDGGRLVFIVVEMLRGKPMDPEKEGLVHFIGFALLMVLVVLVTFSDIRMLIG